MHRYFPPWLASVADPLAILSALVAAILAPDVFKPLVGCLSAAICLWWFMDGKPWDRRLGYAVVSSTLGYPLGVTLTALIAWFWPGWPHMADIGVYASATLVSIYIAQTLRGVFKAWSADPGELADLIKDVLHRWAGRGVRRPAAPPAASPAEGGGNDQPRS